MLEIACSKLAMPKPLNREQSLENQAFLRELRRSGNVRDAARSVGKAYGTMQHRRAQHPAFAARWDAALALARARLLAAGGEKRPWGAAPPPSAQEGRRSPSPSEARGGTREYRTKGGEPVVVRARPGGPLQLRRAHPGKLTEQCEQAFLAALSATANVRLSAAAAGASVAAFYRRKRQNPAFAREWRLALERGYEAVQMALLQSMDPASYEHDAWRHNEPPAVPPMTANQALQLLYLHQKEALMLDEPPHLKPRRGEPREAHLYRLARMYEARQEREREKFRVAEAERQARGEGSPYFNALGLPDLSQVTGWSKADPAKKPHDPDRALFGGWRLKDWEEREGE